MNFLIQQSPEWLEMRRNKIGASDAPIILGLSPWSTPYQLWETKVGIRPEKEQTEQMKYGLLKEETARKKFEEITNMFVLPQVVVHSKYDWMMASLDGMDIEHKHIVEIKCPGKIDHQYAKEGKIPDKYFPQLQHQLEVCNLDSSFYFSYFESFVDGELVVDTALLECKRDEDFISKMIKEEKQFFSCMQDFIPPKMIEKDFIKKTDLLWTELAKEFLELENELTEKETRKTQIREMLIHLANGANSEGCGVKVSKLYRKGSIDYSSIPELKEINLDKYRKSHVEYWKVSK
jgi:putative phage-type endonuclease